VRQPLKAVFCGRFDCSPEHFEQLAFRHCLPGHARILAPLVLRFAPRFFQADLQLIRDLGNVSDWRSARAEILIFQEDAANATFLRRTLRIRVSGRKAARLAGSLLCGESITTAGQRSIQPGQN